MQIMCAWCNTYMGEKPGRGTTHGICPKCFSKQIQRRPVTEVMVREPDTVILTGISPEVGCEIELHVWWQDDWTYVSEQCGSHSDGWEFDGHVCSEGILTEYLYKKSCGDI